MFPGEPIDNFVMGVVYTECTEEAEKFREEVSDAFDTDVVMDELSTVIGCHIGAGAVAAATSTIPSLTSSTMPSNLALIAASLPAFLTKVAPALTD